MPLSDHSAEHPKVNRESYVSQASADNAKEATQTQRNKSQKMPFEVYNASADDTPKVIEKDLV